MSALVLVGGGWLAGARYRTSASTTASPARQAQVLQRSSSVMPFDQTKTTHMFKLLGDGGTQVVIANDPADQTQITLVQEHLREEAARFARGDLADPATIHGQDMPGLAALEQATARGTIAVRYQALANGALLRSTTGDPPPWTRCAPGSPPRAPTTPATPWDSPASTPAWALTCLGRWLHGVPT